MKENLEIRVMRSGVGVEEGGRGSVDSEIAWGWGIRGENGW